MGFFVVSIVPKSMMLGCDRCRNTGCCNCLDNLRCERCEEKSNCLSCFDGDDYDVERCEDCGSKFCRHCREMACAENWDGACRTCASKIGINLPEKTLAVFYMYHSAVWDEVRAANPMAGYAERSSIIVRQYKSLSKTERVYWNVKEKEGRETYQQQISLLEKEYGKFNIWQDVAVAAAEPEEKPSAVEEASVVAESMES